MKKLCFIFLILVSVVFSFTLPEGKYELSEQGVNYSLYVPPKLSNKMILVFHDDGQKTMKYVDYWYEYAKKANYLILAPESYKNESGWTKDDEERLNRLLSVIARDYGSMKTLINGVSASGHFAILFSIHNPNKVDALCNFTGVVVNFLSPEMINFSEDKKPIPYLFVHGMLEQEISSKYAKWDAQKMSEKGYDVTYWDMDKMQGQVNKDILGWFEEVISQ